MWHVDDLNISHFEISEVTRIIKLLKSQYVKMRIYRGRVHDYLGVELD